MCKRSGNGKESQECPYDCRLEDAIKHLDCRDGFALALLTSEPATQRCALEAIAADKDDIMMRVFAVTASCESRLLMW